MAIVVTLTDQSVMGNKRVNVGRISLDASYPLNGYPVTAQQFGIGVIEFLDMAPPKGYVFDYDPVSGTVRVYADPSFTLVGGQAIGTPVQVDAGGNLGKTAPGNITAVAVPAEVPVGTNLSAVTNVPFQVRGV